MANLRYLFILLSGLLLAGCLGQKKTPNLIKELKGEVFGSYYIIKYYGELPSEDFFLELNTFFKEFNDEFSTYQSDSVISTFNKAPVNHRLKVTERFIQMLELAKKFNSETQGAFEPTLGPVIKAWGFGGGKKGSVPNDADLNKALKRVGFKYVEWDKKSLEVWKTIELTLDVNAFAPGWAADLIGERLVAHSVNAFMIDVGGEILFKGKKANDHNWIAGIETPSLEHNEGVQLAFAISDLAIATSGSYRQFFDDKGFKRSHIISPKTGKPVTHQVASASVLAPTAAQADAWGTAMMVLGEDGVGLAEKNGIKVYLLKATKPQNYEVIMSPGMSTYLDAHRF